MSETLTQSGLWIVEGGKADRTMEATVPPVTSITGGSNWASAPKFRDYQSFLRAVQYPYVWACMSLIAYTFAANDSYLVDIETGVPDDDPNDPFLQLWEKPNPFQTGFQFRELLIEYLELTGNVYITLENRDGYGRPRELYLPDPSRMVVVPDPHNYIAGYYFDATGLGRGQSGGPWSNRRIPYDVDEVIHIRYPNPTDLYYGMGNIEASQSTLDIIEAMQKNELGYWRSGGRIIGVLSTDLPLNDEDFKSLRREWALANSDDQARARTAVLSKGLKYTPVSEGFKSLDIVNIDKSKRDQILAVWGVPLPKLGIMENAQYKLADADQMFHGETMAPKYVRLEDGVQPLVDLFHGGTKALEFARKNYEDDTRKFQNAQIMLNGGFLLDEARVYAGADPLPNGGGQVYLLSTAYSPVKPSDLQEMAEQTVEEPPASTPPSEAPGNKPGGRPSTAGTNTPGLNPNGQGATGHNAPLLSAYLPNANGKTLALSIGQKALGEMSERDIEMQLTSDEWNSRIRALAVRRRAVKSLRVSTDLRSRLRAARVIRGTKATTDRRAALTLDRDRFWSGSKSRFSRSVKTALGLESLLTEETVAKWLEEHPKGSTALRDAIRDAVSTRAKPVTSAIHDLHRAAFSAGYQTGTRLLPQKKAAKLSVMRGGKAEEDDLSEFGIPNYVMDSFPETAARLGSVTKDVLGTTVDNVYGVVYDGIERDYSADQILHGVPDDQYDGLQGILDDADQWRAPMIARTSTMSAYNAGTLASYSDADVAQTEAVDGTDDPECADRNGQRFTLDEADTELAAEHPNGTLAFLPVFDEPSAADDTSEEPTSEDGTGDEGNADDVGVGDDEGKSHTAPTVRRATEAELAALGLL